MTTDESVNKALDRMIAARDAEILKLEEDIQWMKKCWTEEVATKVAEIGKLKEQSKVEMDGIWLLKNQIHELRELLMEKHAEILKLKQWCERHGGVMASQAQGYGHYVQHGRDLAKRAEDEV